MVGPLEKETKHQLELEWNKLKKELDSIDKKLNEFRTTFYELESERNEIKRRMEKISDVLEEFKEVNK